MQKDIYNTILVDGHPRGKIFEGIISGTPKPGTCMSMTSAEPDGSGRNTYEPWNGGADGEQDEVIVLLEDIFQGKTKDDAYADGSRGRFYIPLPGDELLVLVANIAGTGDAFAIKDKLMIDDGTGKLIATTGTPEMEPFKVLETVSALTEDTLVLCRATGH